MPVGIAGSEAKCRLLESEYGFDGMIDYKHENVADKLGALSRSDPALWALIFTCFALLVASWLRQDGYQLADSVEKISSWRNEMVNGR